MRTEISGRVTSEEGSRGRPETPLRTLTLRELISLLAGTEEQIRRLRGGDGSIDESANQVRALVRRQDQVIGELRRRRGRYRAPFSPSR